MDSREDLAFGIFGAGVYCHGRSMASLGSPICPEIGQTCHRGRLGHFVGGCDGDDPIHPMVILPLSVDLRLICINIAWHCRFVNIVG